MSCDKNMTFKDRVDARAYLLVQWSHGRFALDHTYWCAQHRAWHLTSKEASGKNPAYRD